MRIPLILGLFLMSVLCEGQKLRVAIASSLLLPFQEIEEQFEAKHNIDIELISGSSGSLTTQIINGAPYDLFISANKDFPDRLFVEGLSTSEPEVLFSGQVYLWSEKEITTEISQFIIEGDFRRIAIANPSLAPFGTTAKAWLVRADLWAGLKSKLVFGNAIGQVNHYVFTKAVDAAFSSNSAAYSDQLKGIGHWYPVSGADISLVPYFAVVLKSSDTQKSSNAFMDYLSGSESKDLLAKYGFVVVD